MQKLSILKLKNLHKKDEMTWAVRNIKKELQRKQSTHKSWALRGKYQKKVAIYRKELENIKKDYQAFAENYDRLYGFSLDPGIYVSNSNPMRINYSKIL